MVKLNIEFFTMRYVEFDLHHDVPTLIMSNAKSIYTYPAGVSTYLRIMEKCI